jgi:hypothetical protein
MDDRFVATPLKPAILSIRDACGYLGGLSRAKLYADVLPKLESVHLGARHFIVVASLDRFIASRSTVNEQRHSRQHRDPQPHRQQRREGEP